jgi:TolB-like protein
MKRALFLIGLFAAAVAAVFAQGAELPRLAVVEFTPNISNEKTKADAITVRNLVESQMVGTRKYQIITRDEIDKLLKNQNIQASSISSAENIKKLQLQNISYIVTGSVDAMGSDYAITVRVLDVSTGQFSHSDNSFMGGSSQDLYKGITTFMTKFVAGMSSEGGSISQTGQTYSIGDRGPGGGFIFYAEGGVCMEVSLTLGTYTWDEAKRVASNHKGGGFTDWRLPTKDELNTIYQNLRKKNLAGLGNDWYWSSSEGNNKYAWNQRFSDGDQDYGSKTGTYSVRAVRAF